MNLYNQPVKPKPLIAIFTSTEGHLSLAEAAQETFVQADYPTVFFQEIDSLFSGYVLLYQLFPQMFGFIFDLTRDERLLEHLRTFCAARNEKKLIRFFEEHRPAVLINTYFMYTPTLEKLAKKHNVPLINILTDPKTVHPLLVSVTADANLAFDQNAIDHVKSMYPTQPVKLISSGWLVRHRFEETYDQTEVRKKLKLEPNVLTLLLSTGSDGTSHILKILPSILTNNQPLQVVVACGHNKTLQASVKALQRVWQTQGKSGVLIPLAFTPNIHEYVQAADLVVGKAGPNSLFETVACHKPFFIITHVSGQEDGNLELVRELNLGYVEENLVKASRLLKTIINDPSQLEQFQPAIKKLAAYNRQAKKRLLEVVESELN
jgi:processive 1,2-diacylglycerol beta-glucosyltransferase